MPATTLSWRYPPISDDELLPSRFTLYAMAFTFTLGEFQIYHGQYGPSRLMLFTGRPRASRGLSRHWQHISTAPADTSPAMISAGRWWCGYDIRLLICAMIGLPRHLRWCCVFRRFWCFVYVTSPAISRMPMVSYRDGRLPEKFRRHRCVVDCHYRRGGDITLWATEYFTTSSRRAWR